MKVIVVGLGVQGHKRRAAAGNDFVAAVDPVNRDAQYRDLKQVPPASYVAALVCIPDEPKVEVLDYLLSRGKHVLVEKPLWASDEDDIRRLENTAREQRAVCYTAYNHRFEPHYVRMRELIAAGTLGPVYHCRMFYGNGTARLVRESNWRDAGAGVLPDLGSHLLDTVNFWFGESATGLEVIFARNFENRSPDHVVIGSRSSRPQLELEMTLLSWRNDFTCDVFAERGSAHIRSLCKWGPTTFTVRTRVLPSGKPPEDVVTLEQADPTWDLEYEHFRALCARPPRVELSHDLWLQQTLRRLGADAVRLAQAT